MLNRRQILRAVLKRKDQQKDRTGRVSGGGGGSSKTGPYYTLERGETDGVSGKYGFAMNINNSDGTLSSSITNTALNGNDVSSSIDTMEQERKDHKEFNESKSEYLAKNSKLARDVGVDINGNDHAVMMHAYQAVPSFQDDPKSRSKTIPRLDSKEMEGIESTRAREASIPQRPKVTINREVRCCFVPSRVELMPLLDDLYWASEDYDNFKRDAIQELRTLLMSGTYTAKEAKAILYQPLTESHMQTLQLDAKRGNSSKTSDETAKKMTLSIRRNDSVELFKECYKHSSTECASPDDIKCLNPSISSDSSDSLTSCKSAKAAEKDLVQALYLRRNDSVTLLKNLQQTESSDSDEAQSPLMFKEEMDDMEMTHTYTSGVCV